MAGKPSSGGIDDLLHAVHIGGEACHDDSPVGAADQPVQRRAHLAFGWPDAGHLRIGRIAQEQVHTCVAQPGHAGQVGGTAVQRLLIELDVAGLQNGSRAGVDRDGQRVRDGVVNGEVLAFEHAMPAALPLGNLDEHRLDSVLAAFRGNHRQGELRSDNRDVGP